jgi:hypothetical protein
VLLGFQYNSVFERRYDDLARPSKTMHLASFLLVLIAFILFTTVASAHRLREKGEDSEGFHRRAGMLIGAALFPLALAIGLDVYVYLGIYLPAPAAVAAGGAVTLMAGWFWYGLEIKARRHYGRH